MENMIRLNIGDKVQLDTPNAPVMTIVGFRPGNDDWSKEIASRKEGDCFRATDYYPWTLLRLIPDPTQQGAQQETCRFPAGKPD